MGIFSRFRDIVSSNLNAILDRAEDPEKLVRLMIQEMEDTLIEVKSNCAGLIADQKRLERTLATAQGEVGEWEARARLAVEKGRDELARAALTEKRAAEARVAALEREREGTSAAVASFKEDIGQLEAKLADARDKQRTIVARRQAATSRKDTATKIRGYDTSEAISRFEAYENGIERLEAEAGLVDSLRPRKDSATLREQLNALEHEDEIEQELARLKQQAKPQGEGVS